jgi:hypothetical protein
MGAALTYGRRYALFALVGIAGEDDLDAPDLDAGASPAGELPRPPNYAARPNGQAAPGQRKPSGDGKLAGAAARSVLGEQLSASLRESLIGQMAAISSADEAAAWARRSLPAKNTLTAADARMVEQRFQARLSEIGDTGAPGGSRERSGGAAAGALVDGGTIADPPHAVLDQSTVSAGSAVRSEKAAAVADKRPRRTAVGALGKTVRLRDKDHRKFVLRQACLVCGRVPSDPHHLTFTQPRALGRRVSDEFTVPVCRVHHRELHLSGDEAAWWRGLNIDPLPVALKLWQQTRGNGKSAPSREGVTPAQAANTPDVSDQDRSGTSRDPNAHLGSAD